jgi:arylamine N-acetyltransferase
VPALVATGLLVLGVAAAALVYRVAPVPGEVEVSRVGVIDPRTGNAVDVLTDGERVSIDCEFNGFGRLVSPPRLEGGFVTLEAVDTYWPPRSC